MKEIFLAGGGSAEDSKHIDARFTEAVNKSNRQKVAYIPVAMEPHKFRECHNWFEANYGGSFEEFEMWTVLNDITPQELENYGGIYIGGGNTQRLLREIRQSNFGPVLKTYLADGGKIYGGSAGAIVLGKDIRTAPEAHHASSDESTGLNLLNSHSVACHFKHTENEINRLKQLSDKLQSPILAIPEESGIIVKDKTFGIVGTKPAALISGDNYEQLQSEESHINHRYEI